MFEFMKPISLTDFRSGSPLEFFTMNRFTSLFVFLSILMLQTTVGADIVMEGFDDISTLPAAGWVEQNNSFSPDGTYFQGNDTVFPAQAGADTSYVAVNFNSISAGGGNGTISNWLITPSHTFVNGNTFSFWTRRPEGSTFPDRLELRFSANGTSTDVGSGPNDVGDFTDLLLTVNPSLNNTDYPDVWTQYTTTLSGLSGRTDGRFAFRYFVDDGGPLGSNSDYIGIDTVEFETAGVPEPGSTIAILGTLVSLCLSRRRRHTC